MYLAIQKFSNALVFIEKSLAYVLVIALPLMVLVNTFARTIRLPIYWMDELAILTMVWLAMLTMSLTLKSRDAVSVTLLLDAVPEGIMKIMQILIDVMVLLFGLVLLTLSYKWFDPLTLIDYEFNLKKFSANTFNFMYQDTTSTLGLPKYLFWVILPFSAFTTSVHALTNLMTTVLTPAAEIKETRKAITATSGE